MTGIPLFWSRDYKTSTTWRASFATEEQFKKACEGPLANLCRLQDRLYYSDDDDDTNHEPDAKATSRIPEETNSNLYLEDVREYMRSVSSPGAIRSPLDISSPFSDITAYSDDTFETTSILQMKKEEYQRIQEKAQYELTTNAELQATLQLLPDESQDGEPTYVPVRTTLTDSDTPLHDKLYFIGDDKTHYTNASDQNGTNGGIECVRPQRVYGLHRTSPSPFPSIQIHKSKQTAISSDNESPPLSIKAPLYVIPELQEFDLQSSPHNSGCGSG